MKQIIIALLLLIAGIVIISLVNTIFLKTLGALFFLAGIGFFLFGVADVVYRKRHGDVTFDLPKKDNSRPRY